MSRFQELISSGQPVLVDVHAEWCGPCKAMSPIVQEVARRMTGRARVLKVDVDRNPALAQQYGIRGVPTLLLFKNGEVVWRQSGVVPAEELVAVMERFTA
ncbi:MAG TPA: thioredoxin [Flavobacteriales bacterium]|mgnify:FL=1|nr:thioredoxin [Flavobacteriales bacterium]HOP43626.1 thioredoxin [Flavobacteriales bacterium]HPF66354.1 thioredoxin [Flavobacteriales bacterium]HPJ52302.1 thioredoxin [Flavobacteriales bacterium]